MAMTELSRLQLDREALRRAVEMMRAEGGANRLQIEQKLRDEPWQQAAAFAAYHCQRQTLNLKPWEDTPSHIDQDSREPGARLLRRMLKAGVSRYEPDPLAALAEARRSPPEPTAEASRTAAKAEPGAPA